MGKQLSTEQLETIQERARIAIRDKWKTDYSAFTHMIKTIEDIPLLLNEINRLQKALEACESNTNLEGGKYV